MAKVLVEQPGYTSSVNYNIGELGRVALLEEENLVLTILPCTPIFQYLFFKTLP